MEVKSGKRARKLESDQVVAKADVPRVKRMLGML
jgi:ribosomal protein L35